MCVAEKGFITLSTEKLMSILKERHYSTYRR